MANQCQYIEEESDEDYEEAQLAQQQTRVGQAALQQQGKPPDRVPVVVRSRDEPPPSAFGENFDGEENLEEVLE